MNNIGDCVSEQKIIDVNEIMRYLPHRFPFLMIDRVLDFTPGEVLVARKNVTYNEPYFTGHFPIKPIMPGVMILEAIAQATGILAYKTAGEEEVNPNSIYYFVGIDKARFRRPVEPGDTLEITVNFLKSRRGIWSFSGVAKVDGVVACEAEVMCMRQDAFQS